MAYDLDSKQTSVEVLARELRTVIGRMRRRMRQETSYEGLSWSHVSTLNTLSKMGSSTTSALARAEGMKPQSMGSIVATLTSENFIERSSDPNDLRQTVLKLTEKGHAWVVDRRREREDWLIRAIEKGLTASEQADLARTVRLLERVVAGDGTPISE